MGEKTWWTVAWNLAAETGHTQTFGKINVLAVAYQEAVEAARGLLKDGQKVTITGVGLMD